MRHRVVSFDVPHSQILTAPHRNCGFPTDAPLKKKSFKERELTVNCRHAFTCMFVILYLVSSMVSKAYAEDIYIVSYYKLLFYQPNKASDILHTGQPSDRKLPTPMISGLSIPTYIRLIYCAW